MSAAPEGSRPERGYSATKDPLRRRSSRDRYCIDVLTQISAVQAA